MIACPFAKKGDRTLAAVALAVVAVLSGCDENYTENQRYPQRTDPLVINQPAGSPIRFDLPGQFPNTLSELPAEERTKALLDPSKLSPKYQEQIGRELEKHFGTPAQPKVVGNVDDATRESLKLDNATLAKGASLYRLHCLHCHGLSGNGRGPTAPWVNPHPRDYRQGIFKFTSSSQVQKSRKPRRDDLLRTLREGIEGTSMPSFAMRPDAELEALVSYVIHLSIRGEAEFLIIKEVLMPGGDEVPKAEDTAALDSYFAESDIGFIVSKWVEAQTKTIVPEAFPEDLAASVEHGYQMFQNQYTAGGKLQAGFGCIACHEDYGRKDHLLYDAWGTIVRPMNLTQGVYRGGRRPVDLYWRIHAGIDGVNMPEPSASPTKAKDVWDVVNFLQVLPYPKMREKYKIEID